MLEETATIVRIEGDSAWIATRPRSACTHCASSTSCEVGMLSKVFALHTAVLEIENTLGASVGDRVVVGVPDAALVRASGIAYLMPLFGLIAVVMSAELLGFAGQLGEGGKALLGICGLAGGMLVTRRLAAIDRNHERYQPKMLRFSEAEIVNVESRT